MDVNLLQYAAHLPRSRATHCFIHRLVRTRYQLRLLPYPIVTSSGLLVALPNARRARQVVHIIDRHHRFLEGWQIEN